MDSKRLLLAIVLSMLVIIGYQILLAPKSTTRPTPRPAASTTPASQPPTASETAALPAAAAPTPQQPQQPQQPAREIRVETPLYSAVFTETGGCLRSLTLKDYAVEVNGPKGYPLLRLRSGEPSAIRLNLINYDSELENKVFTASATSLNLGAGSAESSLSFTYEYGGISVVRLYTFRADSYAFRHKVIIKNNSGADIEITPEITMTHEIVQNGASAYTMVGEIFRLNDSFHEVSYDDMNGSKVESGKIDLLSLNVPYFLSLIAPETSPSAKRSLRAASSDTLMQSTLVEPPMLIPTGTQAEDNFLLFYGPQNIDLLEPLGRHLGTAVDFGWFDIIAKPMLSIIKFTYSFVGNYGVAIIIVTFVIKLVFWPLTRSSYRSMKRMQLIQPQVDKLRAKYGNNKQALNQEVMKLYKANNVNPMGGCGPIFIQIPVFFAFYKVLGTAVELRHAPFTLWINDLAAPDRLPIGINIPWVGDGLPVLTLLMGASMFLQQKLSPTAGDPMQRKIMMFMPIVFTIMFISFPSGLVLYWLTNNLLSIAQQLMVLKSSKA
jgi:YidC/Oxa1 family membrane protein insertase